MGATKMTFDLPDAIRARLKALAAHRGTTVTALLNDGASLVLAKYQVSATREELRRRVRDARERLRLGLASGPAVSGITGEVIAPSPRRRRTPR